MGTYTKSIGKFEVPQTVFKRIVKEVFDNGACQCFKDCDCYSRKGLSLGTHEVFTHPLSTKQFYTLKNCEQSYSSKLNPTKTG